MPVVAGGLLISVLLLLQVLGLISLHRASLPLVRGLLGGWAEQKGFRKWFLKAIGVTALANAIEWVVHRVRQSVARAAAANLDAVTLYLHDASVIAHWTYKELGDAWHDYAATWAQFRTQTLPRAIKTHTLPAVVGAERAGRLAGRSISLGNANRIRFGRSIDRLRKELGLLAGILLGIDILVKRGHAAKHHADHTRTIPQHGATLRNHGTRLGRLEKALGLGVIGALILRTVARVAPWLFCRNWKKIGNVVCGLNPGRVDALLALLVGTLALRDIRTLARFAESVEDDVARGLGELLGIGDLPRGRFTVD